MKTVAQDFILLAKDHEFGQVFIQHSVFKAITQSVVEDSKNIQLFKQISKESIISTILEEDLSISIQIKVMYGQNVQKIVYDLQKQVSETIAFMTGIECKKIDVEVLGFYFDAH